MPKTKKEVKKLGKATKKVAEPKYVVSLSYNGEVEVLKGDDLVAIFREWSQRIFKTVVLLSVESEGKRVERRLSVIQAKRIAGNYTNAEIFANDLLKFLNVLNA